MSLLHMIDTVRGKKQTPPNINMLKYIEKNPSPQAGGGDFLTNSVYLLKKNTPQADGRK